MELQAPKVTLPLKVSTQRGVRFVGWFVVVPFAVFFWLLWLGVIVLGIGAWLSWPKKALTDITILLFVSLLLPSLIFAVVYFASGWVHDFLATYELGQDGLTKRSPLWAQKVLWHQVVEWKPSESGDVWWLLNEKGRRIMSIDWHMLQPEIVPMMKAFVLQQLRLRWDDVLARWSVQGKTFRPSDGAITVTVFETLLCVGGAISLLWNGLNSLWSHILFSSVLAGAFFCGLKALRLATKRVHVQGDWLTFSELFHNVRLNLKAVTEVRPMLVTCLTSKRVTLEGVVLVCGSEQIRLTQELRDFHLLMLYLAQRVPETWGKILQAMATDEMRMEGDHLEVYTADVTEQPRNQQSQEQGDV